MPAAPPQVRFRFSGIPGDPVVLCAATATFTGLWKYIKDWQNVFKHFDRDRSGSIDGAELRDVLAQFGYNLSPAALRLVQLKHGASPFPFLPSFPPSLIPYSFFLLRVSFLLRPLDECSVADPATKGSAAAAGGMPRMLGHTGGGGLPGISFDRFVRACVVVKQLSKAFGRLDADRDGWIQIGYEGFIETVLSLP
ncbi:hypothetical protein B0H17DRAFT_1200551 [Mycena rosella]|uniref:EF-hand domain-containing protein n=1 Tax=Mycena rosella TaxID=1033263 RepID=A0AAD7DI07_MYCRO|nr:hypothetical protein B0H17DRAFT_1200551 [Mycena rosella]